MARHHATPEGNIPFTSEEEIAKDAEEAQVAKDREAYAKIKYRDDRETEYPKIGDQLDKIYHSGINEWKKDIKAVKDKYPKP